jgi:hypothetical protein
LNRFQTSFDCIVLHCSRAPPIGDPFSLPCLTPTAWRGHAAARMSRACRLWAGASLPPPLHEARPLPHPFSRCVAPFTGPPILSPLAIKAPPEPLHRFPSPPPYSLDKSVQRLSSTPPLASCLSTTTGEPSPRRNHARAPPSPSSVSATASSNLTIFAISHPSPQPCRAAGPFPRRRQPRHRLAIDEPLPPNREP